MGARLDVHRVGLWGVRAGAWLTGSAAARLALLEHIGEPDRSGHALRRYRNCQARDSRCARSEDVQAHVEYALYGAQCGEEYASVKALKGFGGRSVLEIVAPREGDTYRAVYTVKFTDAIYVLHAFQKKSKSGSATPKTEINLIRQRLADAERLRAQRRK